MSEDDRDRKEASARLARVRERERAERLRRRTARKPPPDWWAEQLAKKGDETP